MVFSVTEQMSSDNSKKKKHMKLKVACNRKLLLSGEFTIVLQFMNQKVLQFAARIELLFSYEKSNGTKGANFNSFIAFSYSRNSDSTTLSSSELLVYLSLTFAFLLFAPVANKKIINSVLNDFHTPLNKN